MGGSIGSGVLAYEIAWRYLRGRSSRLLHRTALAALASVAVGVFAMTIAMALLTGYREDLQRKLISGNAAVLAYPLAPEESSLATTTVQQILDIKGVVSLNQTAYGQGTVSLAGHEGESVTLRGASSVRDSLAGESPDLAVDSEGVAGVVLGEDLADALQVAIGDPLRLTALGFSGGRPRFAYRSLRVTGTFRSGFAEFDRRWVVLDRSLVEAVSGGAGASNLLEIEVVDAMQATVIGEEVQFVLGPDFLVTDWRQMNRELFSALRLQQLLLFFLLGLIVVVSTFNVASSLMVLVRERMREVGVLKSLGMRSGRLARVFIAYGLVLGAVGVTLGLVAGSLVCWVLTRFEVIRFDPEVAEIYFVNSIAFRTDPVDLFYIALFSLVVTGLACWPPARKAARVSASDALRYE